MKFILNIVAHIALSAAAIIFASKYIDGVSISTWQAAVLVTFALFAFKYTVKPILSIVTLPINIVTFGLFSFVINGILLILISKFVEGFDVASLVAATLASIIISLIKTVGGFVIDIVL